MSFKKETIGDVVELITNGVNCKQNKEGNGVKISRIETIANREINYQKTGFSKLTEADKNKYKLIKGDILFSHINSPIHVGKVAIYNGSEDLYHGVNLLKLRVKNHINPYYFKYFLDEVFQSGYWSRTSKQSVNQASVNQTDIKKIDFLYPILSEQQSIVAKLDSVFAEIDRTIEIAEASSIKTQDLFKKELTKTFLINHEGWIKTTIEESCGIKSGITLKKNLEKLAGDIPYLKVADMNLEHNSEEITTSSRYVMRADISDRMILRKGSVIFPKRGGAIATNKKRLTKIDICVDLNIMSVHPLTSLSPQLLYYFFLNVDMTKLGSGSSIPQINHYDILPLAITYPSNEDEQLKLVKKLKALKDESDSLSKIYYKKIGELKKLKSLILEQKLQLRESA